MRELLGRLFLFALGLIWPLLMVSLGLSWPGYLFSGLFWTAIPGILGFVCPPLIGISLESCLITLILPVFLLGTFAIFSAFDDRSLFLTNLAFWYGSSAVMALFRRADRNVRY